MKTYVVGIHKNHLLDGSFEYPQHMFSFNWKMKCLYFLQFEWKIKPAFIILQSL